MFSTAAERNHTEDITVALCYNVEAQQTALGALMVRTELLQANSKSRHPMDMTYRTWVVSGLHELGWA